MPSLNLSILDHEWWPFDLWEAMQAPCSDSWGGLKAKGTSHPWLDHGVGDSESWSPQGH